MSRHFFPDAAARWARREPRGYRPAPSGLKGLRPLRGGLRPPLTPETSGRPGRAAERAGPRGLPGNAAAPPGRVDGNRGHKQGKEGTKRYWTKRTRRARE